MSYIARAVSEKEIKEFGLPPETQCFELDKVIEERCDDLDYYLEDQGYEILHQEYIRVATSIYNYRVYALQATKSA